MTDRDRLFWELTVALELILLTSRESAPSVKARALAEEVLSKAEFELKMMRRSQA